MDKNKCRLSIVILTWNESEDTLRCLSALNKWIDHKIDEIIVFDNGSYDGTDNAIKKNFPEVKYIFSERNLGIGPGRNAAISYATGKFIMTLDNDTWFLGPNPGEVVESFFNTHQGAGVAGFRLLNSDRTIQANARRFPGLLQPFAARLPVFRNLRIARKIQFHHLMRDMNWTDIERPVEVDYVLGANQVFRRTLFNSLGGYDRHMFYGAEDMDFCYRAKKQGYKNFWIPQIDIIHEHKRRSRTSVRLFLRHLLSFYYMHLKKLKA